MFLVFRHHEIVFFDGVGSIMIMCWTGPWKLFISNVDRDVINIWCFFSSSIAVLFLPRVEECALSSILGFLNTALWKIIQCPACCLKSPKMKYNIPNNRNIYYFLFLQSYSQQDGRCNWRSSCVKS